MEYKTDNLPALRRFIAACEKANIVVWVRNPRRLKWIVSLDRKSDVAIANELALLAGMCF